MKKQRFDPLFRQRPFQIIKDQGRILGVVITLPDRRKKEKKLK
ncbi:hypothetical protein ACFOQM_05945 [Paenibacillus sp. GCM10012307]|nr:hypothetical protein [Paenibacillus roseus]